MKFAGVLVSYFFAIDIWQFDSIAEVFFSELLIDFETLVMDACIDRLIAEQVFFAAFVEEVGVDGIA